MSIKALYTYTIIKGSVKILKHCHLRIRGLLVLLVISDIYCSSIVLL